MTEKDSWASLVAEFMRLNDGREAPKIPTADLNPKTEALRLHLMMEELGELSRGLNEKDLHKCGDAITDLLYVVVGTGVALGLGPLLDSMFREVHASNMTKELGSASDYAGSRRAVKGPNFKPPQLAEMIDQYVNDCFAIFKSEKP